MTTSNDRDPLGGAPAVPPVDESDVTHPDSDPDALREEIAATRADLADTMTELSARTDVKARAHDAVENAKAHAHDAVSSVVDRVKDATTSAAGAVRDVGAAAGHGAAAVAHKAKDAISHDTGGEPPAIDSTPPAT